MPDTQFQRPEIIRPPSEWRSYFLPLTSGCSNNTCTFCRYYGSKLRIRDVDDVKREVGALAFFVRGGGYLPGTPEEVYAIGRGWDGKRIFLQDGDALVYPFPKLTEVLEHVGLKLPFVQRIGAYATAQDILRKSPAELAELKRLKLGILYLGVESGDDEVLRNTAKGATSQQMIEAGRRVKEAGILLSVTVLLGLGGVPGSERHAGETAKVLTEIDPDYAGALTLTLVPGTPLFDECQRGAFVPVSPFESIRELADILAKSELTNCFFSSMHASNYLSIRAKLPEERNHTIAEINHVLAQGDPSQLRAEFLRGL
ncbi:MAG: radical SAM protein [Chloroflexi bacterium]|nr:radical SAM protein [Chloroflexota bacterium]